jgi:hypothetical protein
MKNESMYEEIRQTFGDLDASPGSIIPSKSQMLYPQKLFPKFSSER